MANSIRKNSSIFLAFLLIMSLTSCRDFFDSEVEYDGTDHTPLLVVASNLGNQDTFFNVFLSRSRGMNDQTPYSFNYTEQYWYFDGVDTIYYSGSNYYYDTIAGAAATLYRDGVEFGSPVVTANGYLAMPINLPAGPASWELKVNAPGFDPVNAITEQPSPAQFISGIKLDSNVTIQYCQDCDLYEIKIKDEPGQDFYVFNTYELDTTYGQNYMYEVSTYEGSENPLAEYTEFGLVFSDVTFEGQEFSIKKYFANWNQQPGSTKFRKIAITKISKDAYRYLINKNLTEANQGNPFAEPVSLNGNVEGGLGYFLVSQRDFFDLPE
jgi:Domain of unknown function (DUF4249)